MLKNIHLLLESLHGLIFEYRTNTYSIISHLSLAIPSNTSLYEEKCFSVKWDTTFDVVNEYLIR